jgi:hypothetical protein
MARGRRYDSLEKPFYVKLLFFNGRTSFHNLTMDCVSLIGPDHRHNQRPVRQVFWVERAKTPALKFMKEPASNQLTRLGIWAK